MIKRTVRAPSNASAGMNAAAALTLPSAPKARQADYYRYVALYYGRPGIGKTTLVTSYPDALLLSCERVSQGIECFDFNAENGGCKDWKTFLAAIALLEKEPKRFATICIDTIDAAYEHCLRYTCDQLGVAHPQDMPYGKGWKLVAQEFERAMDRMQRTGRGLAWTSHAKEVTITAHSGEEYTRIQPTCGGQAYNYVKAKSDFVFYCEYVKDANGQTRRVLITEGDEVVDAKHAGDLPRFLPMDKARGVALIADAFGGEDVGISPEELRSSKQTTKVGGQLLNKERAAAARKEVSRKLTRT